MATVTFTVDDVKVGTKPGGIKRLLLTLNADGDIDALAAQIEEGEELDVELPSHAPPGIQQ